VVNIAKESIISEVVLIAYRKVFHQWLWSLHICVIKSKLTIQVEIIFILCIIWGAREAPW
jgi:hypothetical protein